jgi:methionyl-tRNA formyltransferase
MKITFLCSNANHPVNAYLHNWISQHAEQHEITLARSASELVGGDILFLISCAEIIDSNARASYRACLVLHASDLPEGRGWSPHVWAILNGAD